jgi:hypothetical protein
MLQQTSEMASISEQLNSQRLTYLIGTDPNNEIDDELFIDWALKNLKNADVHIMCVPGSSSTDPEQAVNIAASRILHLLELFPGLFEQCPEDSSIWVYRKDTSMFQIGTHNLLTNINAKSYNTRFSLTGKMIVDYYIDIAPNWHIHSTIFASLIINKRIVMGNIREPHLSINLTKAIPKDADELLKEYALQEQVLDKITNETIVIPTHFARQVAIPYNLMKNLPATLKTPLKKKAFDQFIGRPPANTVWAADISNANLATISNMFTSQDQDKLENKKHTQEMIELEEKIDSFLESAPTMSVEQLKQYKQRLMTISSMVMHITGCVYKDSNFNSSSMGTDYEIAKLNWNTWIDERKCDGTPAYDLIAAAVLINPDCLMSIESCKRVIRDL